ncbi:MAG TPA: MFS transporter, partial [Jatrophihabitans sp.]|nr:MFS transporter [Jatrophihabitans sp.]
MITVLRNGSFRRLLAALAVSQLGDWLYNVALLAYVFERTHSPVWLGATTAARVLPIVLLGPVAGLLGDRFDRRAVMIASDLVRAATMLALVVVAQGHAPVVLVPVLAALATAAASPYAPCVAATVPRLVATGELTAANALRSAIGPVAIVAGPAVGALALALGGPAGAFAVNAGTFLISAALTAAVADTAAFRPSDAQAGREPGIWSAVSAGARELLRHRSAARLVGADVLCSFVYGVETVALVAISVRLGWSESGYGVLLGAVGLGGVAGTAVVPRVVGRVGRPAVITAALLAIALAVPLTAVVPAAAAVALAAAATGAGSLAVEVLAETTLQEQLPDEVFARAYGFAFPVSIGGIAAGSLVTAPLVSWLGLTGALIAVGAAVAAYALWLRGAGR